MTLALMWALCMIMGHVRCEGMTQGSFTTQDQPRQRFVLDGAYPSFRVGVQMGAPRRQRDPADPETPPQRSQANALCERLIGTLRRECLDGVDNLTGPPVQPQHTVAYSCHFSSSSGEECALLIQPCPRMEVSWRPQHRPISTHIIVFLVR